MKKHHFIFTLFIAIFMITMAACSNSADSETDAPAAPDNTSTDVEESTIVDEDSADAEESEPTVSEDEPTEVADLPTLPRIENGQARGVGGGGGFAEEAAAGNAAPATADLALDTEALSIVDPYYTDVFSGTTFVLNSNLPTDVVRAAVQQQGSRTLTLEEARALADSFGFSTPLYVQPEPIFELEEGIERVKNEFPVTYYAFDGTRTLTMDAYGMYYYDSAIQYDSGPATTLPIEQLTADAEAFLTTHNVLDFPYTIDRGWGNEVYVYRSIDGRTVNQPEITVSFNSNAEIVSVGMQKLANLTTLGNYPLRSADEAWQLVQDGIVKNNITYYYSPIYEDEAFFESELSIEEYRYWQRSYQPGEEIHMYNWPTIYLPADGVGTPRIETYPLALQANEADLQAIAADNQYNQYHFWGVVSADGTTLELAGWEMLPQTYEPVFFQGTAQRDGDTVLFTTQETGETYILPGAPTDLPQGELLNLFGWGVRDTGEAYAVIDWENLDLYVEYPEFDEPIPVDPEDGIGDGEQGYPSPDGSITIEPMPIEPYIYEPFIYEQFTVNTVELVYFYSYIYPDYDEEIRYFEPPTVVLQPVWQFSGEADNGDLIELYVEAVAPEYLD
ncbi:MAG: hypothetical protein GY943_21240 [Chloroflexi bacterium]|nr:hypothetical protein [Chloroflexota bacterium]